MGPYIRVILLSALLLINLAYSYSDEVEKATGGKPHFTAPKVPTDSYLCLYFNSANDLQTKLIPSEAKKDGADESISKYDGVWSVEVPESSSLKNDFSLVLKSKARHHAIATKLNRPFKFDVPELVIQYEVRFDNGMDCGGAYIKLLSSSPNLNLSDFNDKTGYTIMFGPDKCGLDYKFHFIIRYKNQKTGLYEEKHARGMKESIENYINDKKTHLYTLVMRSDNTFEIFVDQKRVQSGSLLDNLEPPINPPAEIDDPNDKKPDDWDEREKIPDPDAKKPDDWNENEPAMIVDESATKPDGWLDDEPEFIPDPAAQQPDDWDSEMDGSWEAPSIKNPKCESAPGCGKWHKPEIPNPKYKGKWSPPLISNPAYKGIWKPAQIPNPDYFEDKQPYKNLEPISALGLELWTMTDGVVFDNFLITDSVAKANAFADETWGVKHYEEKLADPNAQSVVDAVRKTAKEKPWVVVVCGLLCTLPIVLCFVFCRSPSASKRAAAAAAAASAKKTDEPTPDDEVVETDIKQATGDDEDEDANEGGSTEDDMVQIPENAGGDADLVTKGDLESDSNEESQEAVKPSKSTVHKRRARKD